MSTVATPARPARRLRRRTKLQRRQTRLGWLLLLPALAVVALLLLAGLQVIPRDVYEAASVDGANKLQQFFRITLPLLVPAILVTLIFRTLDALRVFDVFYVFFGNRPDTQTMAVYTQSTIVGDGLVGYGAALSVAIFLIISLTIFPQIAILGALYTLMKDFHLYDRLGALIFTYLIFTLPFTVWVLTSFMRALPGDLEEAAYVDGATPLQVFYKVLLPLIAPGLVT